MSIFVPPEKQIQNIREWNKTNKWGIHEQAFSQLTVPPESLPRERFPFVATVLVPYLAPAAGSSKRSRAGSDEDNLFSHEPPKGVATSTHLTCFELARLVGALHPKLKEHVSSYPKSYLLPNVDEPEPGLLRWETIDFAANQGQDPNACVDRQLSPHAGVLAAICHFPEWVRMIDAEEIPGVWISGYAESYKIALFRNHDPRASATDGGVLELQGYSPGMGSTVGNRARRPLAVPRFR